jgi:hypothetical protein
MSKTDRLNHNKLHLYYCYRYSSRYAAFTQTIHPGILWSLFSGRDLGSKSDWLPYQAVHPSSSPYPAIVSCGPFLAEETWVQSRIGFSLPSGSPSIQRSVSSDSIRRSVSIQRLAVSIQRSLLMRCPSDNKIGLNT